MKIQLATLTTSQELDLALRLQHEALRRAGDEARRQAPEHNRWIAPDVVPLLSAIFASEACRLETGTPVAPLSKNVGQEQVEND